MLAPTKKPTTEKYTEICIRVPAENVAMIRDLLKNAGHVVDISERELIPADEVFPDSHPGKILKGLRTREDMTQAQLAGAIGLRPHHISEMEHGKRVIGKEVARRLAKALNSSYKMFL
jgi:DNA-binding XRE family transcriptional regulator